CVWQPLYQWYNRSGVCTKRHAFLQFSDCMPSASCPIWRHVPFRDPTMTNDSLQLNLGSLRSAISLTLHTHHAARVWRGRAPSAERPGIIGLDAFVASMNRMKRGAEQDDPYSDWWMLRIEE